jgi:autoinducer 2-degrading protein
MFTVLVQLQVRPEALEAFMAGIGINARASLRDEPGCLRFDVHQQVDDPHRFVLHEIYTDDRAFYETHRSAPHYAAWQEVTARCVVPGGHVNTFCTPVFPDYVMEMQR